jgi:CRP-like cAMP-binding protein
MLDSPDGENVLCYLRPGAFFGEMAFLGETRRTANASCEGRVTVLELDRGDLGKLEQQFPEFARVLAEHARQRLLANLLSASPLFRGLDAEQRALAVQAFEPRIFAGGEQLLAEDERASGLYVIASGVVQLVKGRGADSTVLGELGVGEVVGEVSVIRRRPASASVRAATKVVAVFLGCEEFDRLAVDVPPLLAEVYRLATARERDLTMVLGGDALPADESLL